MNNLGVIWSSAMNPISLDSKMISNFTWQLVFGNLQQMLVSNLKVSKSLFLWYLIKWALKKDKDISRKILILWSSTKIKELLTSRIHTISLRSSIFYCHRTAMRSKRSFFLFQILKYRSWLTLRGSSKSPISPFSSSTKFQLTILT